MRWFEIRCIGCPTRLLVNAQTARRIVDGKTFAVCLECSPRFELEGFAPVDELVREFATRAGQATPEAAERIA